MSRNVRNLIIFLAVMWLLGVVMIAMAFWLPPVQIPETGNVASLSAEEANRVQELTFEKDLRAAIKRGFKRGVLIAYWVFTPIIVLAIIDNLIALVTGGKPPIEARLRGWLKRRRSEESGRRRPGLSSESEQ